MQIEIGYIEVFWFLFLAFLYIVVPHLGLKVKTKKWDKEKKTDGNNKGEK